LEVAAIGFYYSNPLLTQSQAMSIPSLHRRHFLTAGSLAVASAALAPALFGQTAAPKAIVTPHLASLPTRRERAEHVARAIAAHERGEALRNLYDHDRGY
jgi:hypothetical protein